MGEWVSERKQLMADDEMDDILRNMHSVLLESAHVDTLLQYLTICYRRPTLLVGTAYSAAFFTDLHRQMASGKNVTETMALSLLPNFGDYLFEDLQQFDCVVMPIQSIGHTADDVGHFVRAYMLANLLKLLNLVPRHIRCQQRQSSFLGQPAVT